MVVDTIKLNEQYFVECDKVINAINKLDKNGAFDERIELLVLAMTYVQMAFNNLLQFKELTYKYDIESTKTYDYRVCSYAEKLYVQANKLINILTKGINGKKIPLTVSNQRKKQLYCSIKVYDILYRDWEIVRESKKVKLRDLTEEQYNKWIKNNCSKYDDSCYGCPFQKVKCFINDAWYLNKDLYSDKFLDQEIEIEEE